MKRHLAILALVCLVMDGATVRADEGLVSRYAMHLVAQSEFAAQAVACGLRSREWLRGYNERLAAVFSEKAGDWPAIHRPSAAERAAAVRALTRRERIGLAAPIADHNVREVMCGIVKQFWLPTLDNLQDGTSAFWPAGAPPLLWELLRPPEG